MPGDDAFAVADEGLLEDAAVKLFVVSLLFSIFLAIRPSQTPLGFRCLSALKRLAQISCLSASQRRKRKTINKNEAATTNVLMMARTAYEREQTPPSLLVRQLSERRLAVQRDVAASTHS